MSALAKLLRDERRVSNTPREEWQPLAYLQLALDLLLQLVLSNLVLPPNGWVLSRMLRTGERAPLVLGDNLVAIDELEVVAEVVLCIGGQLKPYSSSRKDDQD